MEFRFIELSFLWYLKEKKIHKNHHLGQSYSKIKNKKKTIFLVCVLFCKCERSHVLERVMFKSYVVNIRSFNSFWREKNNNNNFVQIFNSRKRKKNDGFVEFLYINYELSVIANNENLYCWKRHRIIDFRFNIVNPFEIKVLLQLNITQPKHYWFQIQYFNILLR